MVFIAPTAPAPSIARFSAVARASRTELSMSKAVGKKVRFKIPDTTTISHGFPYENVAISRFR